MYHGVQHKGDFSSAIVLYVVATGPMPASSKSFAGHGSSRGSSVSTQICGIRGDQSHLRRVHRRRIFHPKQAKGLTRDDLDRFLAVEPDNLWDLCNRAMLSLGYDLFARGSELVALSTDDITPLWTTRFAY